jgi:hypothetical protein
MTGATHAALDHRQQVCTCYSSEDSQLDKSLIQFNCQLLAGFQTPFPGAVTPGFSTPSGDLDLTKIGEARKSLVGVKLDQVLYLRELRLKS